MRLWWILPAFVGSVALCGCTPPPDYLFVDPHVQPVRVELRKSFGVIHQQYGPVPITDCAFFAKPDKDDPTSAYEQEIWRIVNPASEAGTLAVLYGVVPPGFMQATPPGGRPPPLEPGRHYKVECTGDAVGMAQFDIPATTTRKAPPLQKREP